MTDDQRTSTRLHHFAGRTVELPTRLSETQLDGRACVHCGHPPEVGESMRPVEAWSEQSAAVRMRRHDRLSYPRPDQRGPPMTVGHDLHLAGERNDVAARESYA
jgi:hypothetical protein